MARLPNDIRPRNGRGTRGRWRRDEAAGSPGADGDIGSVVRPQLARRPRRRGTWKTVHRPRGAVARRRSSSRETIRDGPKECRHRHRRGACTSRPRRWGRVGRVPAQVWETTSAQRWPCSRLCGSRHAPESCFLDARSTASRSTYRGSRARPVAHQPVRGLEGRRGNGPAIRQEAPDRRPVSLRYFNVAGCAATQRATGARRERPPGVTQLFHILTAARPAGPVKLFGDDYPTPDGPASGIKSTSRTWPGARAALEATGPARTACYTSSGTGTRNRRCSPPASEGPGANPRRCPHAGAATRSWSRRRGAHSPRPRLEARNGDSARW